MTVVPKQKMADFVRNYMTQYCRALLGPVARNAIDTVRIDDGEKALLARLAGKRNSAGVRLEAPRSYLGFRQDTDPD